MGQQADSHTLYDSRNFTTLKILKTAFYQHTHAVVSLGIKKAWFFLDKYESKQSIAEKQILQHLFTACCFCLLIK
jgi:hypothetical protein